MSIKLGSKFITSRYLNNNKNISTEIEITLIWNFIILSKGRYLVSNRISEKNKML